MTREEEAAFLRWLCGESSGPLLVAVELNDQGDTMSDKNREDNPSVVRLTIGGPLTDATGREIIAGDQVGDLVQLVSHEGEEHAVVRFGDLEVQGPVEAFHATEADGDELDGTFFFVSDEPEEAWEGRSQEGFRVRHYRPH